MTTDICLSPVHDWYILLSRISISRTQPLQIPRIFPWSKKLRESEKHQRCEGLRQGSLLWCPRLTRTSLRFSGKCHNTGLIESRNRRAAKKFRLCNAQRSPKNHGNSAQSFSNHENKPNKRQGKSPRPKVSKKVIFSLSTRCF